MKNTITVIDYGINNIQSVIQAFNFIGVETIVANNSSLLKTATHIVLPGVGAFPEGMKKLKKLGLDKMIKNKAMQKSKILGICLGMQMLFSKSYEYRPCEGLNLIPGELYKLKTKLTLKIVFQLLGEDALHALFKKYFHDILDKKVFYYLHSFQVKPENKKYLAYYDGKKK